MGSKTERKAVSLMRLLQKAKILSCIVFCGFLAFICSRYISWCLVCLAVFSITAHLTCNVSYWIQEDKEHLVALMENGLSDKFPRNINKSCDLELPICSQ